tara:strand:+ start:93 stop:842 length:750 start_codon:yes stop_codon:yes gene_type:complete
MEMSNADYEILLSDIKKTIDKNDELFKLIQKANYPDAGSYSSTLLNYKIDTQVTDLKKARTQIWDFLSQKYEENSNLRAYYFSEIRKVDTHIEELEKEKTKLINKIETNKIKQNTFSKSLKNEKYNYYKMEYYLFLYKLLVFIQLALLAVITLCIVGILPKTTCLVLTVIILIATIAFVSYYVFYVNIGRSQFSWGKFEHNNDVSAVKGGQCVDTSGVSQNDKAKANVDDKIDEMIKESKNDETCEDEN